MRRVIRRLRVAKTLSKAGRKALEYLGCFSPDAFVEPSVLNDMSGPQYLFAREQGLIEEQWGGFATWRPFVRLTDAGRQALILPNQTDSNGERGS